MKKVYSVEVGDTLIAIAIVLGFVALVVGVAFMAGM